MGVKPRRPKGRAVARRLDAAAGPPTRFHASATQTNKKFPLDSNHGIYRDHAALFALKQESHTRPRCFGLIEVEFIKSRFDAGSFAYDGKVALRAAIAARFRAIAFLTSPSRRNGAESASAVR